MSSKMSMLVALLSTAFVAVAIAAPTSTDDIVDEQAVMTQVISDDAVAPKDTLTQVQAGGWISCDSDFSIKIRNGNCLDASQRNKHGGKVHLWPCDSGNHNQRWRYKPGEFSRYQPSHCRSDGKGFESALIKSTHTGGNGMCLDASQRNTNGGKVHMWGCSGTNYNQAWNYYKSNANAHGVLRSTYTCTSSYSQCSGLTDCTQHCRYYCLDATGSHNSPGGKVHMWECDSNNNNQKWEINYWRL